MEEIDINNWNRKEHFEFFSHTDLPFYNTCFNLEIGNFKNRVKELKISLNTALMYVTVKSLLKVENFLLRYENGKVIKYDSLTPSFAHIKDGEELFRFITVEYNKDIYSFSETVKEEINKSTKYFDFEEIKNRTNFVFISSLPWIPFTSIDHTLSLNKFDSIPRITWGKYENNGQKIILPYNIQVNHIFIDGLHIGKFYESLNEEIHSL
jgi:chloramphenicol O-acetyltransferase type A